jgi:UDP-2,3-diacylglucosamine pyrophosphatase LpxH
MPVIFTEQFNYASPLQRMRSTGGSILVLSDFHLGAGLNHSDNYTGTENFIADQSFKRLLNFLDNTADGKRNTLVINGDLVDFLRISAIPETDEEIASWQTQLALLGVLKSPEELKQSINKRERKFGLQTNDYKSVWKLMVAARGHRAVFSSLATWLQNGHQIIMLKGNHDLEVFWKLVRDAFKLEFCKAIDSMDSRGLQAIADEIVGPNLAFCDHALIIDETMYFEHGHRFERFTAVDGSPTLTNKLELNLPFGSFFNRYLINKIELAYPYVDNIRPRQNILSILIRERFPLAVKLLFCYLPLTIRVIPKKLYRYAFYFLLQFLAIIVLPLAITAFAIFKTIHIGNIKTTGIWGMILPVLKDLVFLSLSYFIGRIMSSLQLSSPSSFAPFTKDILEQYPGLRVVSFGHTHNPEKLTNENESSYYNTGTWIPVFEASAADLRIDKTYTILCIGPEQDNNHRKAELVRWNDDACRLDSLPLMERS